MTTVKADTWQRHRLDDIDVIRAGLLDIIDHGHFDHYTPPRPPSRVEQDATYRPGDPGDTATRFHYAPTLKAPGRSAERSDPTGKAAIARERATQEAVTDLSATVSALAVVVGDHDPLPDELETRTIPATYSRPARTVVDADPAMCRIHVLEVCDWLEGLVRRVAGGWREGWAGDATQIDRAKRVGTLLAGLRRRVAPDRPAPSVPVCRPCVECGDPVPVVEGSRAHGRCRVAKSRRTA